MLNDEILETIQQIAGIFLIKNVPVAPINLDYLEIKIAPGMETLVLTELIMHLEDLFTEYLSTKKQVHKFTRYVESFKLALADNSHDGSLVGKSKRSA